VLAAAAVAKGKVIIGGSDSHLLEALDGPTGEPAWSVPVGARMLGSPTVIGNVVVYGAEDFRVYTLDLATGLGLSMAFTRPAPHLGRNLRAHEGQPGLSSIN
jgi:eukaryotic-like serine/threonine-protein kinase